MDWYAFFYFLQKAYFWSFCEKPLIVVQYSCIAFLTSPHDELYVLLCCGGAAVAILSILVLVSQAVPTAFFEDTELLSCSLRVHFITSALGVHTLKWDDCSLTKLSVSLFSMCFLFNGIIWKIIEPPQHFWLYICPLFTFIVFFFVETDDGTFMMPWLHL